MVSGGGSIGNARENLEQRRRIASWVAAEVMPHEAAVRAWLRRARVSPQDVDEVIQDAYCRLAMLDSIDHIDRPDAYFFSIARNLLLRRLKRERVVPIDAIAEIDAFNDDLHPSPEQQAAARLDYAKMLDFMNTLPERCRTIVMLRKIQGWSQKEIAAHLGTTEKAVEKQVWVGMKAIQRAWSDADRAADDRMRAFETSTRQVQ
jgi:RNA polymerase sigma factor (sigma-70 family)